MIALAAAYAVAFNLILPPALVGLLSLATGGERGAWVLCSAGDVAPAKRPEGPQPACPGGAACALPTCAGGLPAGEGAAPLERSLLPLPDSPPPEARVPARFDLGGGHLARGPPAA